MRIELIFHSTSIRHMPGTLSDTSEERTRPNGEEMAQDRAVKKTSCGTRETWV